MPRLILLGVGTATSPRFAPAGLLVEYGHTRVGLDGGPGSEPPENIDAWLVTDPGSPLQPERRRLAREEGMPAPEVKPFSQGALHVQPLPLATGRHGYRIVSGRHAAVWAPDFADFPEWARAADLVFADGAVVLASSLAARRLKVKRLVFVRLVEPVFAALDAGDPPPYGEWGEEGRTYRM